VVGYKCLDVPLLDSKQGKEGTEICDVIIITKHIVAWEEAMTDHYASLGYTPDNKLLQEHSHQVSWRLDDNPVVSVSFWPKSDKLMVQPGMQCEERIFEWLRGFASLKEKVFSATDKITTLDADNNKHTETRTVISSSVASKNVQNDSDIVLEKDTSASDNEDTESEIMSESQSTAVQKDSAGSEQTGLRVTLPPIINELLCFVQNQVEGPSKDTLANLCVDFYSFDVISAAKQVLFNSVTTRRRYVARKGNNKATVSMHDIIEVFLEMDVIGAPIFVARNLADLPPISVDCMDSVKVLAEITSMKVQMSMITTSNQELLTALKSNMNKPALTKPEAGLAKIGPSSASHSVAEVVVKDHIAEDDPNTSSESEASEDEYNNAQVTTDAPCRTLQGHSQQTSGHDSNVRDTSDTLQAVTSRVFTRTKLTPTSTKGSRHSYSDILSAVPPHRRTEQRRPQHRQDNVFAGSGNHGRKAVQSRDSVLIGTGARGGLTAPKSEGNQRQCTGIFISRLKPRTTSDSVIHHIWNVSGFTVKVERIQTRFDGYSSFHVQCDRRIRDDLMQADLWPQDALIKPYYA
jgi:hypothetical protein